MELGAFSISLAVKNIEASKDFYEKFGFKVIGGDASAAGDRQQGGGAGGVRVGRAVAAAEAAWLELESVGRRPASVDRQDVDVQGSVRHDGSVPGVAHELLVGSRPRCTPNVLNTVC